MTSKSREHIIPESLGNIDITLPLGVVCDKCNNYFGREVDKPFLENDSIKLLRFEEGIISKKGRIPVVQGLLSDEYGLRPIPVTKVPSQYPVYSGDAMFFSVDKNCIVGCTGKIYIPKFDTNLSLFEGTILTRFLAKIAFEYLAFRLKENNEWINSLIDTPQFDDIREHARLGRIKNWPCSVRKIYDKEMREYNPLTEEMEQIINELDILITTGSEYYFVMALFGIEYAINLGGAEIDGYYKWLQQNNNQSPLYIDKNKKM